MRRLVVPPRAEEDLSEVWEYIARDKPTAATKLIFRLRSAFKMLRQRPLLGQRRSDLQAGLRAFCVKKYVIFYRFDDQAVTIVRVLHGARDAGAIFAEGDE